MNIRWNALCLGGFLALTYVLAQPVMADEWNKKTEFEFSGPVEIPGRVLPAGKYVFQLEDNQSDRNIVQIYSEDSNGKESFVTTLIAIPEYRSQTPDKPIVNFEERSSGAPEAIHSWFYPGENTGWESIYRKGGTVETGANTPPAPAPVTAAAAPSLPDSSQATQAEPAAEGLPIVEEEVVVAQNDTPAAPAVQEEAPAPAPDANSQDSADRMLPETGGHSGLELSVGLGILGAWRRRLRGSSPGPKLSRPCPGEDGYCGSAAPSYLGALLFWRGIRGRRTSALLRSG